MSNHTEIRWHGRGGQGAKTAALLLADVAFKTGKYVQGFPELEKCALFKRIANKSVLYINFAN